MLVYCVSLTLYSFARYPQFRLSLEDRAIYSDDGGMVFADKAIQAFYNEALKLGIECVLGVIHWTLSD
jgi:hypothetical protein